MKKSKVRTIIREEINKFLTEQEDPAEIKNNLRQILSNLEEHREVIEDATSYVMQSGETSDDLQNIYHAFVKYRESLDLLMEMIR